VKWPWTVAIVGESLLKSSGQYTLDWTVKWPWTEAIVGESLLKSSGQYRYR